MIAPLHPLRDRYDAVLIDLDGTLLDGEGQITPRTRRGIRALVDVGMEVLLCTGRSWHGTVETYDLLGLDTAIVSYNGEWIGRPGESPWRYAPIPDPALGHVARVESHALFSFRHNGERKVSLLQGHPLQHRVADWFSGAVLVEHEHGLPGSDLLRVSCFFDAMGHAEAACARMAEDVRSTLRIETWPLALFPEFADTGLQMCEIQVKSRGKAEAFAYLQAARGIPAARTIAIGDQNNDLSMLEAAGLAVAMANGTPEVHALAHLVIGDHREDGIAAWVEAGAPLDGATFDGENRRC